MRAFSRSRLALALGVGSAALAGCASGSASTGNRLPAATFVGSDEVASENM